LNDWQEVKLANCFRTCAWKFAESLADNFTLQIRNFKVAVFTEALNHERPETHEVCWKGKQTGGISNVAKR